MNHRFLFVFSPVLAISMCLAAVAEDPATSSADLSGKWQISWQARLGTEQATVEFRQVGDKVSGTFKDLHGSEALTGRLQGKQLTFEVQFDGPRPFTIGFSGKVDGEKLTGTSQAKNVGTSGAYMGHGGEVVQPEHPWTGERVANHTTQSGENNSTPPAKN